MQTGKANSFFDCDDDPKKLREPIKELKVTSENVRYNNKFIYILSKNL